MCFMAIKRVVLVPMTTLGVTEYIETLRDEVSKTLSEIGLGELDVLVWPDVVKPPMKCFDWDRVQYNAGCIAKYLRDLFQVIGVVESSLIIGIGYLDGYEYGYNFVFGEAVREYNVAVVFTKRLKPEFYGEQASYDLYYERLVKEILHELGHLLNLGHCSNHCVMRFSNSVREVDEKPKTYCDECGVKARSYISSTK